EGLHQSLARRGHALIAQHGARLVDDPDLAVPHVQIDGTIDHGWLLLFECPVSAGQYSVCGAQATTLGSSQPLHLISVVSYVGSKNARANFDSPVEGNRRVR